VDAVDSKNYLECLIGDNVYIGKNVVLGRNVQILNNTILYDNSIIGENTIIMANSIIGEMPFHDILDGKIRKKTEIGRNSIIGSGSIIYNNSSIGDFFRLGNNSVIREDSVIGNNCSIGTLTDIQGRLNIGNNVRIHSNCFICEMTEIHDGVLIFPSVTITNDLYPPNGVFKKVILKKYSKIGAQCIILPGVIIGSNAFVGAGSLVTRSIPDNRFFYGTPAKDISQVDELVDENGVSYYPVLGFDNSKLKK